jgi:predicted DsbA family dithiol-disulfide isomerase
VAEARATALDAGVTATPGFLFESGLLVTGAHPRDVLRRWVTRMAARAGQPGREL